MKSLFLGDPFLEPWFSSLKKVLPAEFYPDVYSPQENLEQQLGDVEIIIDLGAIKIDKKVIDLGKKLRFIQVVGVGFNHIDVNYVIARNILLANTPGPMSG